ncbi:hypothetical protein ACFE04_008110 [Oxalis oulophora]
MAKICFILILVTLTVFIGRLTAQKAVTPAVSSVKGPAAETPKKSDDAPPESPEEKKINKCVQKISRDCAETIYGYIFIKGDHFITVRCCMQLVSSGKECHDTLVNDVLKDFKDKEQRSLFIHKSLHIWNYCSLSN